MLRMFKYSVKRYGVYTFKYCVSYVDKNITDVFIRPVYVMLSKDMLCVLIWPLYGILTIYKYCVFF